MIRAVRARSSERASWLQVRNRCHVVVFGFWPPRRLRARFVFYRACAPILRFLFTIPLILYIVFFDDARRRREFARYLI